MAPAKKIKNGHGKGKRVGKGPKGSRIGNPNIAEAGKPYQFKKGNTMWKRKHPQNSSLAKIMRDQLEESCASVDIIKDKAEAMDLDPERTSIGL